MTTILLSLAIIVILAEIIVAALDARHAAAIREASQMSSAELYERNFQERLGWNFNNIYGAEWKRRHGADKRGDV